MPGNPSRKFTVMDAMVLVAAVAIGLAAERAYQASIESARSASAGAITFPFRIRWFVRPAPLLASLTLALFALRLHRPRPRYRRLVGSPGFAACYAAAMGLAFATLTFINGFVTGYLGYNRQEVYLHYLTLQSITFAAPAVAAVWIALALLGRWRRHPARDWIEVSGIVIGFGWLVLLAATQLIFYS